MPDVKNMTMKDALYLYWRTWNIKVAVEEAGARWWPRIFCRNNGRLKIKL
jgi:hypothetical protein